MDIGIKNKQRLTIEDIARLANVSKSTVSEVINNNIKEKVSQKTFERVQQIIKKYNYVPSPQAQALTTQRTRQIGFLVSSTATLGLANSYFGLILSGVETSCMERGYRCNVSRYDLNSVKEFVLPSKLQQPSVDALIIAGTFDRCQEALSALNIPTAILGKCDDDRIFQLYSDMDTTMEKVFDYLVDFGHRHILLPYSFDAEKEELMAGISRCNAKNEEPIIPYFAREFVDHDEFKRGVLLGELAMKSAEYAKCTALVSNDQICCGFLQALTKKGWNCPEDYTIISGDDTILCEWNAISLTSCASNSFAHGYTVASLMIDFLENKMSRDEVRNEMIALRKPDELIIRDSSGPAIDFVLRQKKYGFI